MSKIKIILFVSFSVLLFGAKTPNENLSCREIIQCMLDSIKNIKCQRYDVKATERVEGRLHISESHVKVNFYQKKIYFQSPTKGVEILWVEGTNKGNATVHSNTLPLVNLDLDPLGSIIRKNQHHTIFDLGTPFIGSVIANTIVKAPKDFDIHFKYAGTLTWNGTDCYQLIIDYPEYKYLEYIVNKGETVTSIAHKFSTSDYKIRYKNDLSTYFGTIKEGKKLHIPVPYSNKVILFIDKKTFLPINIKVYDEEGLYEAYEFTNMTTNKPFATDEFSKTFKGYGF